MNEFCFSQISEYKVIQIFMLTNFQISLLNFDYHYSFNFSIFVRYKELIQ
jgi:hypothetical protein